MAVTFSPLGTFGASAGTGATVATVDAPVMPSFADVTYTYRVRQQTDARLSAFSNTASAILPALPVAPSNLIAVNGAEQEQGALRDPDLE